VRADDGEFYVLEDNLRVPSGVSYMLENRKMMMRLFRSSSRATRSRRSRTIPISARGPAQRRTERHPRAHRRVLTPDVQRAYFEHAFLAQQMAWSWSKARSFRRRRAGVHAHHARTPPRGRHLPRIDDDFLDPLAFRPDSSLAFPACSRSTAPGA